MHAHAANQARTFLALFARLRPYLHTDRNLPSRLQQSLQQRAFGSRDRRLYRELLYTAIRHLPWIESALARSEQDAVNAAAWLAADLPATRGFKESFAPDSLTPHASPLSLATKAAHLGETEPPLPAWFRAHCPAAFEPPNVDTLHTRAPLWLRLQTDEPSKVFAEFEKRALAWRVSALLPDAVELLTETDATQTDAYARGLIEIQDLGSQLVLASAAPQPGGRWFDACAGAGGKTIQLARLLGPAGHVTAHDIRSAALDELATRATRAGLRNITLLRQPPSATELFDGVLVDAPCTGSGTWRRAPHLKWCTTEADVTAAARIQSELLTRYAAHVRPGGQLIYATCSLSRVENEDISTAFLAAHPEFTVASSQTILPATHNTDGFYVAVFRLHLPTPL